MVVLGDGWCFFVGGGGFGFRCLVVCLFVLDVGTGFCGCYDVLGGASDFEFRCEVVGLRWLVFGPWHLVFGIGVVVV